MKHNHLRAAFSLIEMLVVIGILGVLMSVLLVSTSGSGDSAKAAKCLTNMKNLATAVQTCGMETAHFPHAGSIEYMNMDTSSGKRDQRLQYKESRGWISWDSKDKYPTQSKGGCPEIGMTTGDDEQGLFAITNGALFKYVGDRSIYTCPVHVKKVPGARWSYLMNAYFGWNSSEGYAYSSRHASGIQYQNLKNSDKILLFAEVPFQGAGDWIPSGERASTETDAILQYKGCSKAWIVSGPKCRDGNEHIGANHKSGKTWYAHVVFADGHTEKLSCSQSRGAALDGDDMRELTTWLCTGKSVTFNGKRYEELK